MPIKKIILVVSCILFFNCKEKKEFQQHLDLKIISLIVDEIAIPLPPPPPPSPDEVDASLSEKTIDSINSIKLKVGLFPLLVQFDNLSLNTTIYPSNFRNLVDDIKSKKPKDISTASLENISKHSLEFTTLDGKDEIENYDLVISISNIVWSKHKDRAVAIATRKLGRFNGTTYLFLFKRDRDKNKINIYKQYVLQKS